MPRGDPETGVCLRDRVIKTNCVPKVMTPPGSDRFAKRIGGKNWGAHILPWVASATKKKTRTSRIYIIKKKNSTQRVSKTPSRSRWSLNVLLFARQHIILCYVVPVIHTRAYTRVVYTNSRLCVRVSGWVDGCVLRVHCCVRPVSIRGSTNLRFEQQYRARFVGENWGSRKIIRFRFFDPFVVREFFSFFFFTYIFILGRAAGATPHRCELRYIWCVCVSQYNIMYLRRAWCMPDPVEEPRKGVHATTQCEILLLLYLVDVAPDNSTAPGKRQFVYTRVCTVFTGIAQERQNCSCPVG